MVEMNLHVSVISINVRGLYLLLKKSLLGSENKETERLSHITDKRYTLVKWLSNAENEEM